MNERQFEWYEVDVEFVTETESRSGDVKQRVTTEKYLVNATSPTEAEASFNKYAAEQKFVDFRVKKAVEKKYIEVVK
jgi:hypothetical protein